MKRFQILFYSLIVCLSFSNLSHAETNNIILNQSENLTAPNENFSVPKKDWTFLVYMAARNDLHQFSKSNMRQMLDVGSTDHINIVVNLDELGKSGTQRYYLEKHNPLLLCQDSNTNSSGNPENLISFCEWGINSFPADHYALILWDHATGPIDPYYAPIMGGMYNFFHGETYRDLIKERPLFANSLEIKKSERQEKGVCFDDATREYIKNNQLMDALETISQQSLNGGKFDIIGFDACLMSHIEITHIVQDFARIMVSSQNVELGPGWNYRSVLMPFKERTLSPTEFAKHIVNVYDKSYKLIIGDYTLSAIDLDHTRELENNLHDISLLLIEALRNQKDKSVKDAIRISKSRRLCTAFDEPSYIDLHHLYLNLSRNVSLFQLQSDQQSAILQEVLHQKLLNGMKIIESLVIANSTGSKLPNAKGISIYFPDTRIHSSYPRLNFFSEKISWVSFLGNYLTS